MSEQKASATSAMTGMVTPGRAEVGQMPARPRAETGWTAAAARATREAELHAAYSPVTLRERGLYREAARRFFRNRLAIVGLFFVVVLTVMAVFADDWFIALPLGRAPRPLIARTSYEKIFFGPVGAFPSLKYWMGTDLNGRDFFSRIVYGARISLSIGFLAQLIALLIGIPLGAAAGWKGGRVDFLVMRLVDIMSAIPTLLFAYLIMARLGAGYWNVMLAIGLTSWISVCRLTRAQFLALREKEFVEASRMIGAGSWRIIRFHLLPNAMAPIIVSLTLGIPTAIFAEASLSFLGVGINPPMPSWGQMLGRDGVTNMTYYWHLAFFPAMMIAITMLGFTLMGDGLRDALDPRMIGEK
jgi:ABC-type dipeptide/oligopeptide/nickel transport system permease subunit